MLTCTDEDPKTTLTTNPMTGAPLFLCAVHARAHREGYTFYVMEEDDDAVD